MKQAARTWLSTSSKSNGVAAYRIDKDFCTFTLTDCQETFRLQWYPLELRDGRWRLTATSVREIVDFTTRFEKLLRSTEPRAFLLFTHDLLRYSVVKREEVIEDTTTTSLLSIKMVSYARHVKKKKPDLPTHVILLHALRGAAEWETKKERLQKLLRDFRELAESYR